MFKKTEENVENITSLEDKEEKLAKLKSDAKIVARKAAKVGLIVTAFVVCYKVAKSSAEVKPKEEETTSTDEFTVDED